MSKTKTLLVLALASSAAFGAYRWHSASSPDSKSKVLDRIWIDHLPRSDRDPINVFVALTEQPVGIFQETTQWRGAFEIFTYEAKRNKIIATFPQTDETEEYTAKECRSDQRDMDYCLQLDGGSRGVAKYYSRKDWVIEGARTPAEIEARVLQLEATEK